MSIWNYGRTAINKKMLIPLNNHIENKCSNISVHFAKRSVCYLFYLFLRTSMTTKNRMSEQSLTTSRSLSHTLLSARQIKLFSSNLKKFLFD